MDNFLATDINNDSEVRPPENQPEIKLRGGRIDNTADINSDENKQDNIVNEQKIESIFFEKILILFIFGEI